MKSREKEDNDIINTIMQHNETNTGVCNAGKKEEEEKNTEKELVMKMLPEVF